MNIDNIALNFSPESLLTLNISIGVIMFGVALNLKIEDFKRLMQQPAITLVGLSSQLFLLPALTALLILVLKPHPSMALGMILVAACPGGNISNFISLLAKGNAALSVSLTAATSLLAVFSTPLNFTFWSSLLPQTAEITQSIQLDFLDMMKIVLMVLAIPLAAGMLAGHYLPLITEKIKTPIKYLSILIFATIVIIAIGRNFENFLQYWHLIVFLIILHNGAALITGYGWASLFRLPKREVRTISLETGIQNSGLGLILVFNFFDGLGGMAIVVAWWGVWHILSGLSLAFYWGRNNPV